MQLRESMINNYVFLVQDAHITGICAAVEATAQASLRCLLKDKSC